MACWLPGRVWKTAGGSEPTLPLLDEARRGFEAIARDRDEKEAERMAYVCISESGECLLSLGRLDEAATVYPEAIERAEQRDDDRSIAVGNGQLGSVRLQQRRYADALAAHRDARERFTRLDEPGSVAVSWHQTSMTYQQAEQAEAAEDAYRESLAIKVRLGDVAGRSNAMHSSATHRTPGRPGTSSLQVIVTGSRDRSLADAPGLDFSMTAEILFLIERLEDPRRAP